MIFQPIWNGNFVLNKGN